MKFKLRFWNAINNLVWLILAISMMNMSLKLSNAILGVPGIIIIIYRFIVMVATFYPTVNQPINESVKLCRYTGIHCIRECIDREYIDFKNLNYYDYYYDYIIKIQKFKLMSFVEYIKYIRSGDYNLAYTFKVSVNKITQKLSLEGTLKTVIKYGKCLYTIGDYTFSEDEKHKISSLANNQNIKLDIVYDKNFEENGHITRYVIVNADTKERL